MPISTANDKLRHQLYGQRSERAGRLIEQMELGLEKAEAAATEDQRDRVVEPATVTCLCCGGAQLSKLGEDVTETLEGNPPPLEGDPACPEKFTCRDCEAISQPPASFRVTPRGWAGPSLLAMIVFEKFGQHQPLNRQSERRAPNSWPPGLR